MIVDTGVFNSCEALATKSRLIESVRSLSVTSVTTSRTLSSPANGVATPHRRLEGVPWSTALTSWPRLVRASRIAF